MIKSWVARLWCEHLQIPVDEAKALLDNPSEALERFKEQATSNIEFVKSSCINLSSEP